MAFAVVLLTWTMPLGGLAVVLTVANKAWFWLQLTLQRRANKLALQFPPVLFKAPRVVAIEARAAVADVGLQQETVPLKDEHA